MVIRVYCDFLPAIKKHFKIAQPSILLGFINLSILHGIRAIIARLPRRHVDVSRRVGVPGGDVFYYGKTAEPNFTLKMKKFPQAALTLISAFHPAVFHII